MDLTQDQRREIKELENEIRDKEKRWKLKDIEKKKSRELKLYNIRLEQAIKLKNISIDNNDIITGGINISNRKVYVLYLILMTEDVIVNEILKPTLKDLVYNNYKYIYKYLITEGVSTRLIALVISLLSEDEVIPRILEVEKARMFKDLSSILDDVFNLNITTPVEIVEYLSTQTIKYQKILKNIVYKYSCSDITLFFERLQQQGVGNFGISKIIKDYLNENV